MSTFFSTVWDNVTGILSSLGSSDAVPSPEVQETLQSLHAELTRSYQDSDEEVLRHLLALCKFKDAEFSRVGDIWKTIGFQRDDPITDLRGGGMLALHNLMFFLENHSQIALSMIAKRSNRENGSNYPWAAAGVNITRAVAIRLEVIQPTGARSTRYSEKPFWPLLAEPDAFARLYACAFVMMDSIFDEMQGSYLDFPLVMRELDKRFSDSLSSSESIGSMERSILAQYKTLG